MPHSAKYEDEYGYFNSVSSQSHVIAPFILSKVLTHHFAFLWILLDTAYLKYQTNPLTLAVSSKLENQIVSNQKIFLLNQPIEFSDDRQ